MRPEAFPGAGAGAHTAFEDAYTLGAVLASAPTLDEALAQYDADVVRRGRALYRSSRNAASYFAARGGRTPPHPRDVLAKLGGAPPSCAAA